MSPPSHRLRQGAPHQGGLDKGWSRALAMLARRALSAAEVDARLARAHVPAELRVAILGRLVELSLLDDARLAEQEAASLARRGLGPRAVAARLAHRGLGQQPHVAHPDQRAAAQAAAGRLLARRFASLDGPAERRRALAFLARRGFDAAAARALVDAHRRATAAGGASSG